MKRRRGVEVLLLGLPTLFGLQGCVGTIEAPGREFERDEMDSPQEARECSPPPRRLVRLSAAGYADRVRNALGIDTEALAETLQRHAPSASIPSSGFSNEGHHLVSTVPWLEDVDALTARAVVEALDASETLDACLSAPDDDCIRRAYAQVGRAAFERPVAAVELDEAARAFDEWRARFGASAAVRMVLQRALLEPAALFRSELGSEPGEEISLTAHELASALASFLSSDAPDTLLASAADDGSLLDEDVLTRHAERLLADPATSAGLLNFFREHLGHPLAATVSRRGLDNERRVLESMPRETDRLVEHVLFEGDGRLSTLLTADFTFVDADLAAHYGLPFRGEGFERVAAPEGRRGVLMHAAFLTSREGVTHRGIHIRERMFCSTPPPPPEDANTNLAEVAERLETEQGRQLSEREVREQHLTERCVGCHSTIDPLGWPFSRYDEVGLFDATRDPDTSGQILGTPASNQEVDDALELVDALAASADVRRCFVERLYAYAHARPISESDRCELDGLVTGFDASGGDIRELVLDIVRAPHFVLRGPLGPEVAP